MITSPCFLHQERVITGGVQDSHTHIIEACHEYIAVASTVSVYIYKKTSHENYVLVNVIAAHDQRITSITWNRQQQQQQQQQSACLLATSSIDGTVKVWNRDTGELMASVQLKQRPRQAIWNPTQSDYIAVVLEKGSVVMWNTASGTLTDYVKASERVMCAEWLGDGNDSSLIVGSLYGAVGLREPNTTKLKRRISSSSAPSATVLNRNTVTALCVDPLSHVYVVVAYAGGRMLLVDTSSSSSSATAAATDPLRVMMEFNTSDSDAGAAGGGGGDVISIAFSLNAPGTFYTTSERSSVLVEWNVSQPTPLHCHTAICPPGVRLWALAAMPSYSLAITCTDGAVYVVDTRTRNASPPILLSASGHCETIFDVRFAPHDPTLLATASYDGSVRVWRANTTFTLEYELHVNKDGPSGAIYALAWSPSPNTEPYLAASLFDGSVVVWNYETRTQVRRMQHHAFARDALRVTFHPSDVKQLLHTSVTGTAVISDPTSGRVTHTYSHPDAVFGCDFNPFDNGVTFCTGCMDGIVRVWRVNDCMKPLLALRGHTARVFNTVYSPLLRGVIASGSDDNTIRVWNTTTQTCTQILHGHTKNVRALVWSPELPHVLFSGSWDSSVRMWSVVSGECLQVLLDHSADIYGLTIHPMMPFRLVSSSRDTTIRVFSYHRLVEPVLIKCVLNGGILPPDSLGGGGGGGGNGEDSTSQQQQPPPSNLLLYGRASHSLTYAAAITQSFQQRLARVFRVFRGCESDNLWSLLLDTDNNNNNSSNSNNMTVRHYRHVVNGVRERTNELQHGRHIVGRAQRQRDLRECARSLLVLGELQTYCEVMAFELNEWLVALAVAPGVSHEYWSSLNTRYIRHLHSQHECVDTMLPHLVAVNNRSLVTNALLEAGRCQDALVAAAAADTTPIVHTSTTTSSSSTTATADSSTTVVSDALATDYWTQSQPILAACVALTEERNNNSNSVCNAVRALLRGDEIIQAFALLIAASPNQQIDCLAAAAEGGGGGGELLTIEEEVATALVARLMRFGMWYEVIELLEQTNCSVMMKTSILTQLPPSVWDVQSSVHQARLLAQRMLASGETGSDKLLYFMMAGGMVLEGVELGLVTAEQAINTYDDDEHNDSCTFEQDITHLCRVYASLITPLTRAQIDNSTNVLDESACDRLLFHSYYSGALQAMQKQLGVTIVSKLIECARTVLRRRREHGGGVWVNEFRMQLRQLQYYRQHGYVFEAKQLAHSLANHPESRDARAHRLLSTATIAAAADAADADAANVVVIDERDIIITGELLPSAAPIRVTAVSCVSGKRIRGHVHVINDHLCMSQSEAIAWSQVCSYGPQCDGTKLQL